MRADRLLSLLMILQTRGGQTAQSLAKELEVTERTIYRDVTALNTAGVPVYTERGPGGGIKLLESFRTNLTGLTPDEVRALFMCSIPAPMAELGVGRELKAALLKLSAALPSTLRQAEGRVRQRIYIDSEWWHPNEEPVPNLHIINQAIWEDRNLKLSIRFEFDIQIEQVVEPYGLVSKAGVWYLVWCADGDYGVQKLSRMWGVDLLDEIFERDVQFDLVAYWKEWCRYYVEQRFEYLTMVKVSPDFIPFLPLYFGSNIRKVVAKSEPPDGQGWITIPLPFESFEQARSRILALGRAVEVLEPFPLRLSIADFAAQTVSLYHR